MDGVCVGGSGRGSLARAGERTADLKLKWVNPSVWEREDRSLNDS